MTQIPTDSPLIFVDFDRTLSTFTTYENPSAVGDPILPMINTIFDHLAAGHKITIWTARMSQEHTPEDRATAETAIKAWCKKWFGQEFPVTADKSPRAKMFYDDKCVGIIPNVGTRVDGQDGDITLPGEYT